MPDGFSSTQTMVVSSSINSWPRFSMYSCARGFTGVRTSGNARKAAHGMPTFTAIPSIALAAFFTVGFVFISLAASENWQTSHLQLRGETGTVHELSSR